MRWNVSIGQSSMYDVIQGSLGIVTTNAETTAKTMKSKLVKCWQECGLHRATLRRRPTATLTVSLSILRPSEVFGKHEARHQTLSLGQALIANIQQKCHVERKIIKIGDTSFRRKSEKKLTLFSEGKTDLYNEFPDLTRDQTNTISIALSNPSVHHK